MPPNTDEQVYHYELRRWVPIDPGFRRLAGRTRYCLWRNGIYRAEEVRAMSDDALLALRNFGVRSLWDARAVLGPHRTTPIPGPHPWWLRD